MTISKSSPPETPRDLERLQRHFWKLITAPEGVARGLSDLASREEGIAPLSNWIAMPDEEAAIKRLDVYANMYFYRLLDCLRQDFEACEKALGKAPFHNVVTDYLVAHPPSDASLRYLGETFPGFLKTHAVADAHPYLSDLARLEWARLSVFDAANQTLLTAADLAGMAPESWPELTLELVAASTVLTVNWSVDDLWRAARLDEADTLPQAMRQERTFLVWRQGFVVHHRHIEETDEQAVVERLGQDPLDFGTLCELLATRDPSMGVPAVAQRAALLLQRWVNAGALCKSQAD